VQFGYAVPLVCYVVVAWFARASLRQDSRAASAAAQASMGVTKRV
jgi:FHS family L-fucose permease-like MFS transporter